MRSNYMSCCGRYTHLRGDTEAEIDRDRPRLGKGSSNSNELPYEAKKLIFSKLPQNTSQHPIDILEPCLIVNFAFYN